jgi:hypothetical protein
MKKPMSVPQMLAAAAETFRQKNEMYGDAYQNVGAIFLLLFPEGISLATEKDYNRFCVFNHIINKIVRYSVNWDNGHDDSLTDLSVYAMMMKELDGLDK